MQYLHLNPEGEFEAAYVGEPQDQDQLLQLYNARVAWLNSECFWIKDLKEEEGKKYLLVVRNRLSGEILLFPQEKGSLSKEEIVDLVSERRRIVSDLQFISISEDQKEIEERLSILKSSETESWLRALPYAEKAHNQYWVW